MAAWRGQDAGRWGGAPRPLGRCGRMLDASPPAPKKIGRASKAREEEGRARRRDDRWAYLGGPTWHFEDLRDLRNHPKVVKFG